MNMKKHIMEIKKLEIDLKNKQTKYEEKIIE